MRNSEEENLSTPDKSSSLRTDPGNIHVFPDWAAMQAYYGPRVAIHPYFHSAVTAGHAPHPYMWGPPQAMIPHYATPYAAIYPHGAVYAPPGFPVTADPDIETPAKLSENTDQGLMKKLKGFDESTTSLGNGKADNVHSQSEETECSSDGSSGNTSKASQNGRKRSYEEPLTHAGRYGKAQTKNSTDLVGESNTDPHKVTGNRVESITELEHKDSSRVKPGSNTVPQTRGMMPNKAWLLDLKRERRKQSNRESARWSRLRKLAEAEDLAKRVECLTAENISLRSELNQLNENSEKLKLENATLMEKVKNSPAEQREAAIFSTENHPSRVDNSETIERIDEIQSSIGF